MIKGLIAFLFLVAALAQKSNYVDRKEAEKIRVALEQYYEACAVFPDQLDRLFEPASKQPDCPNGVKALLEPSAVNKDTVSKLVYTPFGYQDYELGMRLFWTRDN